MKRRFLIGLPILAAILAMSVGVALSKKEDATKASTNLSGQWVLDASKSDMGAGMRGRGGWRGRAGGEGRPAQGDEGRGRRGRMRLPEHIRIEQTAASLTIADSADVPIQTIGIGSDGSWSKGRLEVVRDGPRGKLTQTFALEEGGRSLVIRTKMEASDSRPSREFKRVYRRSST